MTILLDAFALLGFLRDEPCADEVERMLRQGDVSIVAVNLAEVIDQLVRVSRVPSDAVAHALASVLDELVDVKSVGGAEAWAAAEIRGTFYRKGTSELSLADCFLIGSAGPDDLIATADVPLAVSARARGVGIVSLPDSHGVRPERGP